MNMIMLEKTSNIFSYSRTSIAKILCLIIYRVLFLLFDFLTFSYHNTNGLSLQLPLNTSNSSASQSSNQSLYTESLINNDTKTFSDNNLEISYLNQTEEADEESFVKGSAGVWVISVMSGTCLLTIAFIVRGLFSRAEAFHDPPENYHGADLNGDLMGGHGFIGAGAGGADMGFLTTDLA
ncbi:unnamed protein product [Trichobilharzia szidati]|nr:unnamed protein product [Trichobilharzia szidati]